MFSYLEDKVSHANISFTIPLEASPTLTNARIMNTILFTSSRNKSGGSRQALYLAQGLAERGHTVTFFVPKESTLPEIAPNWPHWAYLGAKNTWRSSIESVMPTDGSACVVHAFHNAAVKMAAWWGIFWRKRAVVVAHRGVLFRPNNPLPYWSPGVDCFLVNSQACGRVLQRVGLSSKRIVYVPNCVPDDRILPRTPAQQIRAQLGIAEHDLLFTNIGNNNPVKGLKELITAFAQAFPTDGALPRVPEAGLSGSSGEVSPPVARLLIIGANKEQWLPLCRSLNVENRVILLGHTEDIASYLAASSVFVLPSLSESMPNTLLEAIRMGLPSIASTVGAVPDIIGNCGLPVPPGDVGALAAAMVRMGNEPALRVTLAAGAQAEGSLYHPEKRLDLVEGTYIRLLQQKGLIS